MKIKDIESALNERVEAKALELAKERARELLLAKARTMNNIATLNNRVKEIDKAIAELDTEDFKMEALTIVDRPNLPEPFKGLFSSTAW